MRKVGFYIPAILMTIGMIALNSILHDFSNLWFVWVVLLWICGLLLSKGKVWGVLFGLFPAAHMILMSTKETGQAVNIEMPLGIFLAVCVIGTAIAAQKIRGGEAK